MAEIQLEQVTKRFGPVTAVDRLNLEIRDGEFISLLGPSGCGKTTVLRMLAGFEKPTEGTLRLGGEVINDVPPQQRNIGIVFQDYAVFPTMTVFDNVAYGLRLRRVTGPELPRRVAEVLAMVGLSGFEARMPAQLSGGQLQRVALARALVIRPRVLLLDEPLSNLDAALRLSIRKEIRKIQQELGITTVFVTHDQEEALSISDRVAVMRTAQLMQVGRPMDIYDRPESAFVAGFIGRTTLLQGRLVDKDAAVATIDVGGIQLRAQPQGPAGRGDRVWVSIRPQHVKIVAADEGDGGAGGDGGANAGGGAAVPPGASRFTGTVDYLEMLGSFARGEAITPAGVAFAFEIPDPLSNPIPAVGATVHLAVDPTHVVYGKMTEVDEDEFRGSQAGQRAASA